MKSNSFPHEKPVKPLNGITCTKQGSSAWHSSFGKYILAESTDNVDHNATALPPWEANPYEPITWWQMIQFSAGYVLHVGIGLEKLNTEAIIVSMMTHERVFNPAKPLDKRAIERLRRFAEASASECRRLGLTISAETIDELREDLESNSVSRNCQWMQDQVKAIQSLITKEMRAKVFVYIPPEKAKFFTSNEKPHLWGEKVDKSFPSAVFDIRESGCCLATMRSTGAVFHAMRVMEIGLALFGSIFGVSLANTNWGPALDQIESNIRNMHKDVTWKAKPNCKELQEQYSQAASHFGIIKDAWRNHAMHVRGKYTEEEAEIIHKSVEAFMKKLASIGLKERV